LNLYLAWGILGERIFPSLGSEMAHPQGIIAYKQNNIVKCSENLPRTQLTNSIDILHGASFLAKDSSLYK